MNIPNSLTLVRIAFIPLLAILFYLPWNWAHAACSLVFILAAVTDWLDGYLARRLNQTSAFGAFLDPVADKLIVAVALILILEHHPSLFMALPVAIIIGREIAISALREWMAEMGERGVVAVSWIGKVKTTAQMTALALLLYWEPIGTIPVSEVGFVLLYAAAILTLWSMFIYLRVAWPSFWPKSEDQS